MTAKTSRDNAQTEATRAEMDIEYQKKAALLQKQNKAYNDYCAENNLKKRADRIAIAKWDRQQAAAARGAAKRYENSAIVSTEQDSKTTDANTVTTETPQYADVMQEWRDTATPNSHVVEDAQDITVNGITYNVDGHNVVLDYSQHEKEIAEILEKEFGGEIKMLPRVNNPQGVSTPDYLYRGEGYDLKTIGKTTGKNPLFNRIQKAKAQANNFVLDITDSELSEKAIEEQIKKVYTDRHTKNVNTVIVISNGEIIAVYKK